MTTTNDIAKLVNALRNPRRWRELTDDECDQAAAELQRLHTLNLEWQQKAATWIASPDAAQRLAGYQELAQRLNVAEQQRDELLAAFNGVIAARRAEGGETNGFISKPATREYEQRLLLAWQRAHQAISKTEASLLPASDSSGQLLPKVLLRQELLELAAKAAISAGMPIVPSDAGPQILERKTEDGAECYGLWRPHENADQSLELSVTLGMKVYHQNARVIAEALALNQMPLIESVPHGANAGEATKQAIFRLAAAIGKTTPGPKEHAFAPKGAICKLCQGTGIGSDGVHSRCLCLH